MHNEPKQTIFASGELRLLHEFANPDQELKFEWSPNGLMLLYKLSLHILFDSINDIMSLWFPQSSFT